MIQQTTAAPLRITDNRISVEVAGRAKLLASVTPDGVSMWCKVLSLASVVSYEQLMGMPTFRAGILRVLEAEQRVAESKPGV